MFFEKVSVKSDAEIYNTMIFKGLSNFEKPIKPIIVAIKTDTQKIKYILD